MTLLCSNFQILSTVCAVVTSLGHSFSTKHGSGLQLWRQESELCKIMSHSQHSVADHCSLWPGRWRKSCSQGSKQHSSCKKIVRLLLRWLQSIDHAGREKSDSAAVGQRLRQRTAKEMADVTLKREPVQYFVTQSKSFSKGKTWSKTVVWHWLAFCGTWQQCTWAMRPHLKNLAGTPSALLEPVRSSQECEQLMGFFPGKSYAPGRLTNTRQESYNCRNGTGQLCAGLGATSKAGPSSRRVS